MNRSKPDWEKWIYRLLLLGGVATWYATTHAELVQCWWGKWDEWAVPASLPVLAATWIAIRRPKWSEAAVALVIAGLWWVILFPAFAKCGCCPGRGRQSSCASNLKQIALATLLYRADHDDRLPPMEVRWTDALAPIVNSRQIYRCPGDPEWRKAGMPDDDRVTYGLNPYLRGQDLDKLPVHPQYVILGWCGDAAGPVIRHNGGCNFAYADGHVKWIAADQDPGIWNPWEPAP